MSFLSSIIPGLSKAASFVINAIYKTKQVEQTLISLAPTTKAAMLAVFYDAVKTEQAAQAAIASAESGSVLGAVSLSATTYALIKQLVEDVRSAE